MVVGSSAKKISNRQQWTQAVKRLTGSRKKCESGKRHWRVDKSSWQKFKID